MHASFVMAEADKGLHVYTCTYENILSCINNIIIIDY